MTHNALTVHVTYHNVEDITVRKLVILNRLQVNGFQSEIYSHCQQPEEHKHTNRFNKIQKRSLSTMLRVIFALISYYLCHTTYSI